MSQRRINALFPEDLTWEYVKRYIESGKNLILVPVGSLEGHGYHLPLDTDSVVAAEIATSVACKEGFVSIPAVTYTIASLTRPGNVELISQTFEGLMKNILRSFAKFGVTRFVIVLGHGGPDMKNSLVKIATELASEKSELHIGMLHVSRIINEVSSIDTSRDRHAGEWETSLMLYLKPSVVGERRAKDFSFPSKHGIIGDPTIGTKEKGMELTNKTVKWIINWIRRMSGSPGVFHNW